MWTIYLEHHILLSYALTCFNNKPRPTINIVGIQNIKTTFFQFLNRSYIISFRWSAIIMIQKILITFRPVLSEASDTFNSLAGLTMVHPKTLYLFSASDRKQNNLLIKINTRSITAGNNSRKQ